MFNEVIVRTYWMTLVDVFGFKCLPLITGTCAKIRSGGIAILVKEHLIDKVKILKNDADHFYWFTLEKYFAYDYLFCAVYIAPEGSNYSNIECFELLERDILNFLVDKYKLCFSREVTFMCENEKYTRNAKMIIKSH